MYERVEVRHGRLAIHPDPYGLAPMDRSRLVSILSAAGVAAADIDPTVLDLALERARDESVSLSLNDSAGSLAP